MKAIDFLRKLGAEPVTYGPGLDDRVARLAPEGIDAALDFVGADAVDTSLRLLGRPDRLASIAAPKAAEQGGHYVWVRPDSADVAALAGLAEAGKSAVHVERVLPLAEAAQDWRSNARGHTRGKLVLSVANG
ncbi:zinc-binding dehydrogenase [Streptomyces sp. NPDC057543]|uniref:zinc-binding dehydrogenase n=1 Tax=Streptomyces sp. NPDC057543 TaxID=3346163 RepID=UPI003689B3D9